MTVSADPLGDPWADVINELVEIPFQHAELGAALARITELARRLLKSHACTLTRIDLKIGHLTTVACDGPDETFEQAMRNRDVPLRASGPIDPDVFRRGEVVERYDLPKDGQGVASTEIAGRYRLQSVLCHPLKTREGALIGHLNHFTATNNPFSPTIKHLLATFARQAVATIERVEWQSTFGRSVTGLNALSENLLVPREDFINRVAETACTLLSVPVCLVWQRAEQEQRLRIIATHGDVDPRFRAIELDLDAPGVARAVATREVKAIVDVSRPSALYAHHNEARERGWVSLLTAPMLIADRLIGLVDVYTTSPRRFHDWEKEFFGIFANYAALSISTYNTRNRLDTLNELIRQMTDAHTIDELLQLFLAGAMSLVGATRGWVSRVDLRTGDLRIELASGDPPHRRTLQWGEGITGRAVKIGQPMNVGDVSECRDYVAFWNDTRSELAIPIMVRHAEVRQGTQVTRGPKPIGVLNIESPRRDAFPKISAELLWSLAQSAATIIEKLEFDQRLAELEQVERQMGPIETFDETARLVLKTVKSTLGYDMVNISLVRPEEGRIKTEYFMGISEPEIEDFKRMADHSLDSNDIQATIVKSGVAEVPDSQDPRFDKQIYRRFGHQDLIRVYVPMRLPQGNRVIGTIEAGYNQTYRRFIYERDVNMLQGFADYAALALEHKKLVRVDLYVAAVLKEALAAVHASQGSLLMVNKATGALEVMERQGRPYVPGHVPLAVGKGIAGIAVRDRRPQLVPDILKSPDYIPARIGDPTFRSMLTVPLVTGGDRAIGVICAHSEAADFFSQPDVDRLVEIAQRVAPTIEQLGVDAFIGHTRGLKQLERFRGVAEELARLVRDPPKLRLQIAKAAEALLDADPVVLYEYIERSDSFVSPVFSGEFKEPTAMGGRVREGDAPYLVVRTGAAHYTEGAQQDPIMCGRDRAGSAGLGTAPRFVVREQIVASAAILLKAGKETVGVLFLNYRTPHAFSEHEKHVIGGFAADAALAIREARAVEEAMKKSHQTALEQNRSVMAHRLKGPVISIQRRLRDILESDDRSIVLHHAMQASRLNRHVQDLIAEFNASKLPWLTKLVRISGPDLRDMLIDVLTANRMRDDTFPTVTIDPEMPAIRVDREALADDFIGLLHDSERHCPTSTRVTVDGRRASPGDVQELHLREGTAFVKLVYRDNGPGIPQSDKERVFDEAFSTAIDGTGLGLTIALANANRLGGTLRERGDFGKGVLFEIILPADEN